MTGSAMRAAAVLSAVRASWGALLLASPARGLLLGDRPAGDGERALARMLGARELLQAAILSRRPGRRWILGGLAVDGAHLLSMLALAAWRPWLRRAVLPSAAVSLSLSLAAGRIRGRSSSGL